MQNRIRLETEWIPRYENEIADAYSKIFDFDDWSVGDHIFELFNRKWGPYEYDLFADCNNNKLEKFYSRFWNPNTAGVDAFGFDWSVGNNWIVPPINLIARTINHLKLCKARGTLIVPKWPTATFWPILVKPFSGKFQDFVKEWVEYYKPHMFFQKGSHEESVFAEPQFQSNVLILRIDCTDF